MPSSAASLLTLATLVGAWTAPRAPLLLRPALPAAARVAHSPLACGGAQPGDRRGRRAADKKVAKRPRPSKEAKLRIGCYGCGASLQTLYPAAAGFVEPERYEEKEQHRQLRLLLCRRCRQLSQGEILPAVIEGRMKKADAATAAHAAGEGAPLTVGAGVGVDGVGDGHGDGGVGDAPIAAEEHGEAPAAPAGASSVLGLGAGVTTPEMLRAELKVLRELKCLVVLLVDVTDVTGSFLPRVRDLVGGNPIVLVGTKCDLLPKGTANGAVEAWLAARLLPKLNVVGVHLVSARTGEGMAAAKGTILGERCGRDLFILGAANVGKSLFVGALLEAAFGGRGKRLPISSPTPGTTLRMIGVDCFDGGSMLFDTPGLHLAHRLSASLLPAELKAILPRGKIKPYTPSPEGAAGFQGTSVFWGGLARFDVLQAPPSARLTFVSACTNLRVTQLPCESDEGGGGFEAAAAHYAAEAGRSLTPPLTPESASQLGALEMRLAVDVDLCEYEQAGDISISGLGWVSLGALASLRKSAAGMHCTIEVWVPKGVQVSLRPPMPIGGLPNEVVVEEAEY